MQRGFVPVEGYIIIDTAERSDDTEERSDECQNMCRNCLPIILKIHISNIFAHSRKLFETSTFF